MPQLKDIRSDVMLTIRAMSDGKGYASRHLEHRDYYAEGERVAGQWQGRAAALLGLDGIVKLEDFEAVRQGIHPQSRESLRPRQSADRTGPDGMTQSRGRHLYDFTISAPKSISIMAILGCDTRLLEAHERAVSETLQVLESHAATRVRQAGANDNRTTGNLVIAVYHHDTSRELDPQVHTHAVAANLTYDGTEGRWKALQASGIYERRAYLTEVYRNSLAREVRLLGYDVETTVDAKGRDRGFEIRGVSNPLLAKYSQRSQQRDKAIEAFVKNKGRTPTDNEVAVLVRESRADKLIEISTPEVRRRQRHRLTEQERRHLEDLGRVASNSPIPLDSAAPSLDHAKARIFERVSVARDYGILAEALRHGRGRILHEELEGTLRVQEASGTILRQGKEIATAESLGRERDLIDVIHRGMGSFPRLGGTGRFTVSEGLHPQQKRVVEFVLDSRDRAVNVRGAAGTGKTATLQQLRLALEEAGREVQAVAPTMSAVEELHKVGFSEAITVERLLQDRSVQTALHHKVLIVDEAGMVSGRQMSELLQLAETHSVRVIFSGDTNQIQSVEAGDALRVLEKESRLKSIALTEVQRQKRKDYRAAIQELRSNPERGFEKLDAMGAVHEIGWQDRPQTVAQAYVEADRAGRNVLVVCPTHDEIDRVTAAIRFIRKQAGALGESVRVDRDVSLNWTTAEKSDPRNFRSGQIIRFHRPVHGIAKNDSAVVVRVEDKKVIIQTVQGKTGSISARHAKTFDVFERHAFEVAPSDKLLLTANRREPRFRATNGEIVTVSQIDGQGRIHLRDGRILPPNYKQFAHGYAVTAHRSQGKSVDSVIISGDGMQKELFYVAASRGREQVLVITSDKEQLRESVAQSTARLSATQLARRARLGLHQGQYRGRAAARDLILRAAQGAAVQERQTVAKPLTQSSKVERNHDQGLSR
jgi:conjugative relaxase-like TrwC/TraI family protein